MRIPPAFPTVFIRAVGRSSRGARVQPICPERDHVTVVQGFQQGPQARPGPRRQLVEPLVDTRLPDRVIGTQSGSRRAIRLCGGCATAAPVEHEGWGRFRFDLGYQGAPSKNRG